MARKKAKLTPEDRKHIQKIQKYINGAPDSEEKRNYIASLNPSVLEAIEIEQNCIIREVGKFKKKVLDHEKHRVRNKHKIISLLEGTDHLHEIFPKYDEMNMALTLANVKVFRTIDLVINEKKEKSWLETAKIVFNKQLELEEHINSHFDDMWDLLELVHPTKAKRGR